MLRPPRNQEGYTILEMMLTIVIVGILAALVLPYVSGGARERRKVRATHDVIRIFHRARSRAIESGAAHLIRYSTTANSNKGALYVIRGTTNRCSSSTFAAPVATQCPSSTTTGNVNLLCGDWWVPTEYEITGSSYTIQLRHTTGQTDPSTASSLGDPDICFDGTGIMYWRIGTSGFFSDNPTMPTTGGATVTDGAFTFSVRTLVSSNDVGVVRRIVVPLGAEARYVQ